MTKTDLPKYIGARTVSGTSVILDLSSWMKSTGLVYVYDSPDLEKVKIMMSSRSTRLMTSEMVSKAVSHSH